MLFILSSLQRNHRNYDQLGKTNRLHGWVDFNINASIDCYGEMRYHTSFSDTITSGGNTASQFALDDYSIDRDAGDFAGESAIRVGVRFDF